MERLTSPSEIHGLPWEVTGSNGTMIVFKGRLAPWPDLKTMFVTVRRRDIIGLMLLQHIPIGRQTIARGICYCRIRRERLCDRPGWNMVPAVQRIWIMKGADHFSSRAKYPATK